MKSTARRKAAATRPSSRSTQKSPAKVSKPARSSESAKKSAKSAKSANPAATAAKRRALPPVEGGESRGASAAIGKYVYCVVRSSEELRFGSIGIGVGDEPAEVTTVNYKDLAAVVSDTPVGVYDPTRENVLTHQAVNEAVMRKHTVLPMSFGTVFKTREDTMELLRSAYDAFNDVLRKMHDKFEFGLKVLWDRDQVIREIEEQDEDIRRLKAEIGSQRGSTYFARMQYGRLVDAALQTRSEQYVSAIFALLRDSSVASRTNKPIGDKMILNAAFLVGRDNESSFDTRVKEIGNRFDKLIIKYTGPWPPYNFVNIRLKLERAK